MNEEQQHQRKSVSLGQAPRANPKVDEFRRAGPVEPGDGIAADVTAADDAGRALAARVLSGLESVFDPELPVNIVDLGLIYSIDVDAASNVKLTMTLTAPNCPVAENIVRDVEAKTRATPGVASAKVTLVFSPPWDRSRMSEAALLELGLL